MVRSVQRCWGHAGPPARQHPLRLREAKMRRANTTWVYNVATAFLNMIAHQGHEHYRGTQDYPPLTSR